MENNEQMSLFNFFKVFENYKNFENKKNNLTDNIFSILGIERWEIKHSKFLAFLLDKERNGEIGTKFIEGLFKKLNIDNYKNLIKLNYSVTNEQEHTDILITFPNKKVVVIENKVMADESQEQLSTYSKVANNIAKEFEDNKPQFIFLTPNKRKAKKEENQDWTPIGYEDIYKLLKNIKISNDKLNYFLNDYIKILEVKVIKKDSYKKFKEFYDTYKKEEPFKEYTALISRYMENFSARAKIMKEVVKQGQNFIVKEDTSQSYIFFYNELIQEALKNKGIYINLVKFQINNNDSNGLYPSVHVYADYGKANDSDKSKEFAFKIKEKWKLNNKKTKGSKDGYFSFGVVSEPLIKNDSKKDEYEKQQELRINFSKWIDNSEHIITKLLSIINEI